METFQQRIEREDEEDRLRARKPGGTPWGCEPNKLSAAMSLLFALKDEGVIAGWSIQFPDHKDRC